MATIVNARDVILQAASPRVGAATLPSNVTIPKTQVTGLGTLAGQNTVDLSTQVIGYLSSGNVTGLGALAALSSVNLASAYTVGDLAANRIGAGSLAAGVTYTGRLYTAEYVHAYGANPTAVSLGVGSKYPTIYGQSSAAGGVAGLFLASGSDGYGVIGQTSATAAGVAGGLFDGGSYAVGLKAGAYNNYALDASNYSTSYPAAKIGNANTGNKALELRGTLSIDTSAMVANLNAQYLQGYTPSSFATAGHNHDGTYLKIMGGAVSGKTPSGAFLPVSNGVTTIYMQICT